MQEFIDYLFFYETSRNTTFKLTVISWDVCTSTYINNGIHRTLDLKRNLGCYNGYNDQF